MKHSILLFSFFFIFLACSAPKRITNGGGGNTDNSTTTYPVSSLNPIFDSKWLLSDAEKISVKIFLKLMDESGSVKLTGNGGCNSYGGIASVQKNGKINFSKLFSTKMFCQDTSQEESNYLSLLSACDRYELEGNELRLYKSKILLLRFVKE